MICGFQVLTVEISREALGGVFGGTNDPAGVLKEPFERFAPPQNVSRTMTHSFRYASVAFGHVRFAAIGGFRRRQIHVRANGEVVMGREIERNAQIVDQSLQVQRNKEEMVKMNS